MHGLVTAATAADGDGGSSIGGFLIPLLLVLAVVYIFSMQRRRAKAQQQQVSQIVPGTLVITTAGLYATVVELEDGDILLEIAPDVVCRFTRSAIARVISTPDADEAHDGESAGGDAHDGPAGPVTSAGETPPGTTPGAGTAVGEEGAGGPPAADGADGEGKGVPRPPRKEL
ncbi:preprotein translocase subunit YajC [Frankia sp. QA3]|uniref:preprotein translocase subunit YajC n=1 Tax=Frankia sp. QA3 TaxID=710111 RepID=UPI000269CAE5|nr:preprotein translocase subunit YajC [Frankia sp. QA3]EIV93223.1 preprotein translocase, YajC subunit [Frankia sp. QA3]